MRHPDLSVMHEFEAALAWWQAAGVDCDFADDATAWLADTPLDRAVPGSGHALTGARNASAMARDGAAQAPQTHANIATNSSPPIALRRNLLGDSPPPNLDAFRQWWMATPGIDTAHAFPRIAPRGVAGAALMVLVPHPEEADRDDLLGGPQGRLLDNILAAIGLDDSAVYVASALPCHTPMADLVALAAGGMDAVTAHHISLVRPARLLVLGAGLTAMLGGSAQHPLREINYIGGNTPVLLSETLDALMDMPRLKARFWRRWMEWSATQ